jgi:hypothetical protein
MYFDPKVFKKVLLVVFLIAGIVVGTNVIFDENGEVQQYAEEDYHTDILVDKTVTGVVVEETTVEFDNGFVHTKPGEYSEIFVVATGLPPGDKHIVYLRRVGSDEYEPGGHEVFPDEFGVINTKFTITSYGDYEVQLGGSSGDHRDIVSVR